ncbi:MAG: hypothetical protein JOY98_05205 [Candidatus Eremiobacteraeota bacterium]|nr:hypothetical protein [Candidatus Eremiobacteraeota bacterium]MBV8283966.1 hypothetical protein [Candidatus Eremiobacteraeota bacterium]
MKRFASVALGAVLLAACGRAPQPAASPAPSVDPEILRLRSGLAEMRAERDAALARLHAAERKPGVVRVVVREPVAAAPSPHADESAQPPNRVFTNLSTSASP